MKILAVDDSMAMQRIIANSLEKIFPGLDLFVANDGVEGFEQYSENKDLDIILLDWNMPNMNGYELLQKLRADGCQSKIIMVTTESEKTNVVKAIHAGANSYITKPFAPEIFREKLESIANQAQSN